MALLIGVEWIHGLYIVPAVDLVDHFLIFTTSWTNSHRHRFPPKGLKGFIPVGPRPTECVLHPRVNANNKLLANFAEKTMEDGTKPKMEIWVVNLGEAFNVRRR